MRDLNVIVLAAGNSTRLKSRLTKVMHPICGRPMIDYVLATARSVRPRKICLVLGMDREKVMARLRGEKLLRFAHQQKRLGTAHAVQTGLKSLGKIRGQVLILQGDVPRLSVRTLRNLLRLGRDSPLSLVTAVLPNPYGYGRILRNPQGEIVGIVEERNAKAEERQINEINAGVYLAETGFLEESLSKIKRDPIKEEFYLTDLVSHAAREGHRVQSLSVDDPNEILGANTRAELAYLQRLHLQEVVSRHLIQGVGMQDPDSVYIEDEVRIGADTTLGSGVQLLGKTRIGADCRIETGCVVKDAVIEAHATLKAYSYLEDCRIQNGAVLGPFARVRPGSVVGPHAHVGNFVELKKTHLGAGSKANHLSYLGDATIGSDVNIGAGTITCNYDGKKKYRTVIADKVFVGSDTQLVAPVKVGKGAYIGAGTTVTKNVPAGSLALTRIPQKNILRYSKKKN